MIDRLITTAMITAKMLLTAGADGVYVMVRKFDEYSESCVIHHTNINQNYYYYYYVPGSIHPPNSSSPKNLLTQTFPYLAVLIVAYGNVMHKSCYLIL